MTASAINVNLLQSQMQSQYMDVIKHLLDKAIGRYQNLVCRDK